MGRAAGVRLEPEGNVNNLLVRTYIFHCSAEGLLLLYQGLSYFKDLGWGQGLTVKVAYLNTHRNSRERRFGFLYY